jgi:outer membrane protein assembly factor BamE (lipoprotein component of BamABCDE complex)
MTQKFFHISASLVLSFCLGCQTNELKQYEKIKLGMDKADVIEIMGSPQQTARHQSKDSWVYKFQQDKQWHEREVLFSEGKTVYVGDPLKPGEDIEIKHKPEFTPLD